MARILLMMPPMPQPMGAPYLGQLYVAASARAAGHEVRCLDLAAPHAARGDRAYAQAVDEAERFSPDIIGLTLFTYGAARGYRLARQLRPYAKVLVAGGPHATIIPEEPVRQGFDVAIAGEGEHAIVALAAAVDAGGDLGTVPGAVLADGRRGPVGGMLTGAQLNALPFPHTAYDCYDMEQYAPGGHVVSGGLMSSRGCPARCTFCANYVTGRGYRWRSTEDIVAEIKQLRARYGVRSVPFWDDAFTARRPRVNAICDAFLETPELQGMTWSVITPGNMVKPFDLERMRAAGCVSVNFGIESGDYNILKIIQKGQRPDQVVAAVEAAKVAGMQTVVNFMFGFPEEGVQELQHTLALMERLAPMTDYFNTRGVLVPFPGTAVYDTWRDAYQLEGWWLDEAMVPPEPPQASSDPLDGMRRERVDPVLARNFFRYSPAVRDMIERCVRFKADHNLGTVKRLISATAA